MSTTPSQHSFIEQATAIITEHIANEQFGVSELAEALFMSRSNLLRKVKKHTQLSASQFIRQVRLEKAMELLQQTEDTISEISYQVGFSNTSYFIKCFREQYGVPPGEVRKESYETPVSSESQEPMYSKKWILVLAVFLCAVVIGWFVVTPPTTTETSYVKKSIAVLPFKNMSNDTSNLYFVNGLMESVLTNLQKIEDLRVVSRTSVEKYREHELTVSEIGNELNVAYLVEGSGQRIDDQVLLNIQLIDVSTDTPIWAEQYTYKVVDVFQLQNTVAQQIANAIQATVTPAELAQISKKPTENLEAYDYYLRALEPFQEGTKEGLEKAIPLFEKAVSIDPEFALAYANLAFAYYYLDIYQVKKQYVEVVNNYADKALLYDSKSAESLMAKALYYILTEEYRLALPHLEKALEYNPNSSSVVQMLGDLYARAIPNTAKYLQYALKGIQLNFAENDSVGKSYIYLLVSNALIQSGFTKESQHYIDLSLQYNPTNLYAPYLSYFIAYATHQNLALTTQQLKTEWEKDTTRLDIMQEVGKFYYFQEKYDSAFYYYDKFLTTKEALGLNIYPQENLKMAIVFKKQGKLEKAAELLKAYEYYCDQDISIYQPASKAMQYIYEGKLDDAIEQLQLFATKDHFQYWMVLFLEKDPLLNRLKTHPAFRQTIQQIETHFWENHHQLQQTLQENGLLN